MGFVIIAASIMLGHMLLGQTGLDSEYWALLGVTIRSDTGSLLTRVNGLLVEWLVGGFAGAIIVGLLTYAISRLLLRSRRVDALTSPTQQRPPA
jgi:hypothetical protein